MEKLPYNEIVFKRIAGDCEAEFYNYMPRSSTGMPKWEIKARYKDGMSKVVILQDCGFNITGRIIEIPVFNTRAERNKIIRGLYHKDGLSQVFLGELFRLSQPAISVIINKSEKSAVVKAQLINVLKGNRLYKSEESVMNRSKKLAITLAVLAALGGSVYVQPEQGFAAEYVIDGDTEFNNLKNDNEWNWYVSNEPTTGDSHTELKNSTSNNTIILKNIANANDLRMGVAGGRGEGEASYNTLVIENSKIIASWIEGGYSYHNDASNNTVIIKDSTINAHVYGGDSHHGDAVGNKVIIAGNSDINGTIYGGYAMVPDQEEGQNQWSGRADNNTIVIKDNVNLENARIYAAYVDITDAMQQGGTSITEDMFTKVNNTVTFDGWSGKVQAVRSADNVNFYNMNLSDFVNNNEKAVVTITGTDDNSSFENIIGSDEKDKDGNDLKYGTKNINIGLSFKGGQDIKANETIRLVKMTGGATVDTSNDDEENKKIKLANDGTVYAGVAQVLKGELNVQEEYIDYKITDVGLNDQVNVVNEGRAASAAFLNQSDELISEALAGLNLEDKYGFETFAMVYGNDSRYGTNSDLSINGWSGLVGVGSNNKTKAGDFAWAAFFENGAGNYDISTTMNGITMEGDGSTVYNGGGIAARLTGENGVYGEASLRAGLLKNDLENGLLGADNNKYGYESESNYYGFHLGIGKIFKLENGASVDTYAKYYHSTVKDDSFTIDSDRFEMDDINSDRLRLGIRYNQGMNREFNVYYGAAWEYEFNGESNGYAQGHKMEETSLKGSTVIGELGVVIQPENSPWSFDAKVKGYGGQRDGYSGSILATYHF